VQPICWSIQTVDVTLLVSGWLIAIPAEGSSPVDMDEKIGEDGSVSVGG
jgi:hypothetical protein